MGKQLVIVGADFSAVAIGTAKVLVSISATISGTQYTNSAPTLVVTATWDDQSTSTVSGYTTNPTVWRNTVGTQTMDISYTRGSVTKTTTVTADVQQGTGPTPTTYTVSASATHGSVSPASTTVTSGGNATFTVSPETGYTVSASDISITSGSGNCGTPTVSGTTVTVPNVTGAVTIAIACHSSGGGETDITSSFTSTWTVGPVTAMSGQVTGDTNWVHNTYVDVSAYSSLKIVTAKTTTATGTLGYSFYDASRQFVDGRIHHYGSSAYGYQEDTITVPSNAKYIQTTWFSQESASAKSINFNAFSCKGVS